MKRRLSFVGLGVLALAVAFWMWGGAPSPARESDGASGEGAVAPARPRHIAETDRDGAKPTDDGDAAPADGVRAAEEEDLSAADRRILDDIQSALDDEKVDAVRRLAVAAQANPSAEVRQQAVEALGWFGEKALEDLTPFLADADDDVRSFAMMAVDQALTQMEDDRAKLRYIESLFQIRNVCDEDGLAMLAGQVKGVSDETAAVAAAVRVIETGKDARAVREMKEVYEFLTGDPYTTPEAAAQWQAEKAAEDD